MKYVEIEQLRERHPAWALWAAPERGWLQAGSYEPRYDKSPVVEKILLSLEASTRYALSLFTRMGLQLLIVTPLQKIRVIEPDVAAVGFVDNPNGNFSRLMSLTITEFRRRLDRADTAAAAVGATRSITAPVPAGPAA
jgi:hypothetical protein